MVEQRTENPRVSGSTPLLGTVGQRSVCGSSSAVERLLAKEEVVGSNPIFRSICLGVGLGGRSGGIGRRDGLKNRWGATLMPVRSRPSAPSDRVLMPSCVAVAQGTLDP